jgi:tetratricopeptide (TPR) repeat protein
MHNVNTKLLSCIQQLQQVDMAIAFFKEAVQLYTYYWPFRLHLALAYVSINELDMALETCSECLDIAQVRMDTPERRGTAILAPPLIRKVVMGVRRRGTSWPSASTGRAS